MKNLFLYSCTAFFTLAVQAQNVFFRSGHSFKEDELKNFYASINMKGDLLLYNAPDHGLYAYDTKTATLQWSYNLGRKSDVPPHFVGNVIWANGRKNVIELDTATGIAIDTLALQSVLTAPYIKDGVVYATGIHDGGCILAYSRQADTIIWKRFIAHGSSVRPYFQTKKIIVNGEGSNWLELNYDGRSVIAGCNHSEDEPPSASSCFRSFTALTHDQKEIKETLAEKIDANGEGTPDFYYGTGHTFALNDGVLYIIGNKLKMLAEVHLYELSDTLEFSHSRPSKILRVDKDMICVLYGDHLLEYDYKKKRLLKVLDLRKYDVHQAILDGERLWLVSRNDGLLYGLDM